MRRYLSLTLALSLLSLIALGCGSSSTSAQSGSVSSNSPQKPSASTSSGMAMNSQKMEGQPPVIKGTVKDGVYVSQVDGKPLCPVLDDEITNVKDAKYQVYKGVKYYFCCDSCPSQFKAHPETYAYKASSSTDSASSKPLTKSSKS